MKLIKQSVPGWTKEYATEQELKEVLFSIICDSCKEGEIQNGFVLWNAINENSSIDDMLNTGCGCEYNIKR
jgi:hypothetical protein